MTADVAPGRTLPAVLAELAEQPISALEKGFGCLAPVTAAQLAARRPGLFSGAFTLPLMILRDSALRHNIEAMAAWCTRAGADLAPHGKTTMAPQLFALQLAAGAWGMTAATIGHAQAYREFGLSRILLANELTDPAGIAWLAGAMAADPGFECYVYADSVAGARLLDAELRRSPAASRGPVRPLPVLVELGQPGGRAGCRSVEEAVSVAKAVAAADSLTLAGAAGYEGTIGHDCAPATLEAVAGFCRNLRELGARLEGLAAAPLLLSAGGSSFFDVVAAELGGPGGGAAPRRLVLRSGAYVTHDHGLYAGLAPGGTGRGGPDLVAALELWAPVLSRPEPGLAVLCAGRRDVSFDQGFPVPLRVRGAGGAVSQARGMTVTRLDDQHAYLEVAAGSALAPGDLVCLGISHPCTAFDKWRVIPVVDDGYRVVDAVHTFF